MNIGKLLKEVRLKRNMSQEEVAKKLGISQPLFSYIEAGRRSITLSVAEDLAAIYGVPLAFILWQGVTEKDVKPSKRAAFRDLKASVDNLINEMI